jgi:HlyD family secretion protein
LTVEADRGDVVAFVRATGQLNSIRRIQVGSQISGNIAEIHADFNDQVSKGQLIALIDTATYKANVELAEAELESAKSVRELRRITKDRYRELLERGHTTRSEMDRVSAELRQAESGVRIRESHLQKAQLDLDRCHILSPTDGVIISRNIDVGQTVAASLSAPVLFEIADDLSRMKINTHVSEADISMISEGQRVEFRVDAWRDQTFEGIVHQVRNAPILVDNVVTYDTVVYLDNLDQRLKPGMTAEVHLITEERRDVLRLRNTALRARLAEQWIPPVGDPPSSDHRRVFRRRDGGSLETVWLETGISDGIYTEVLCGLEEGDVLAVGMALQGGEGGDSSGRSLFSGRQAQY